MSERDIFTAARQITDPAARSAYLDEACGGLDHQGIQLVTLVKNLDGDIAAKRFVACTVDDAHPAARQFRAELKAAEASRKASAGVVGAGTALYALAVARGPMKSAPR
jgi:hypothetical protein